MEGTFAIISPFLTGILVVLIIFISKILRDKSRNDVIMKAIEHGVELSPEIMKDAESRKKSDPLTSALVTIGLGIGLFAALFLFFNEIKFAAFGLIPLMIGLGQLTAYLVNKKNKNEAEKQNS